MQITSRDKGLAPSIRLAVCGPPKALVKGLEPHDEGLPTLLVSYAYLDAFEKARENYTFENWVLDSGAFSAKNSGKVVKIEDYIETCKRLASDQKLTEVFALDVIDDWKAGQQNTEAMWKAGVEAIPCFHYGEPEELLKDMAEQYPKIALGGAVGLSIKKKMDWASQCFARVWPKKIHGFGFGGERAILNLPFHSVDATNWESGPCRWGEWYAFASKRKLAVRGGEQDLRAEVKWYLKLQNRARLRWVQEMQMLEKEY